MVCICWIYRFLVFWLWQLVSAGYFPGLVHQILLRFSVSTSMGLVCWICCSVLCSMFSDNRRPVEFTDHLSKLISYWFIWQLWRIIISIEQKWVKSRLCFWFLWLTFFFYWDIKWMFCFVLVVVFVYFVPTAFLKNPWNYPTLPTFRWVPLSVHLLVLGLRSPVFLGATRLKQCLKIMCTDSNSLVTKHFPICTHRSAMQTN